MVDLIYCKSVKIKIGKKFIKIINKNLGENSKLKKMFKLKQYITNLQLYGKH